MNNFIYHSCLFLFVSVLSLAAVAQKQVIQKWVSVSPTKELYVEQYPAASGKPTVVLLHGLTYTTHQWKKMIAELQKFGIGVICYDMEGMGQSLLKYAPIRATIPMTSQIDDLHILLKNLKLKKPYNLVGLSYGGGVGFGYAIKHPENVGHLVLMATYIKPLQKVDDYVNQQVAWTRLMNPFNPYTDEQVYEFYFRQFVYQTYPMQEPIVLENPYKLEAVFRMSYGVSSFIPEENVDQLKVPTHMMVAANDQYFPPSEYEDFWNKLPAKAQKNYFLIQNSEHKIPEAQPARAAELINQILR